MKLDDMLKLVQQLLGMYKKNDDRDKIVAVLENIYALIMDDENADCSIIDFMDAIMFDVDYLIEHRGEIIAKSSDEKENKKRRRKMLEMFSEDY